MNSNQHRSPESWDTVLGQAIKNLPDRPVPSTLLPQVMTQVNARAAEKDRRPLGDRRNLWARASASVLLFIVAVWVSWFGFGFYETQVSPLLDHGLGIGRTVFSAFAGSLLGSKFGSGIEAYRLALMGAGLLILAMYATCVCVGSLVYRVVRR
jgi:hypothetical protein